MFGGFRLRRTREFTFPCRSKDKPSKMPLFQSDMRALVLWNSLTWATDRRRIVVNFKLKF